MNSFSECYDLSLAFKEGQRRAWFIPGPTIQPVELGSWVGSVEHGGRVNFFNLNLNPHAHGSHTETLGHVCKGEYPINEVDLPMVMKALLISVETLRSEEFGERITVETVKDAIHKSGGIEDHIALIVRTLPNSESKRFKDHSHKDAPYFDEKVGQFLAQSGIEHWLVDLPSVDREEDGGALACHRSFWNLEPDATSPGERARCHATITELIFIPSGIKDGTWSLNLQVAPISNDAAPSKPILFK